MGKERSDLESNLLIKYYYSLSPEANEHSLFKSMPGLDPLTISRIGASYGNDPLEFFNHSLGDDKL